MNAPITDDANMWRYLRENAPPEGCIVQFRPAGKRFGPRTKITWGVPFNEAAVDELLDTVRDFILDSENGLGPDLQRLRDAVEKIDPKAVAS